MKVRSDKHSIYIRTGGYLFRPLHCNPHLRAVLHGGGGRFAEGNEVRSVHAGGKTVTVTRKSDNRKETWYSYGAYRGRKTTDLWVPNKEPDGQRTAPVVLRHKTPRTHRIVVNRAKMAFVQQGDTEDNTKRLRIFQPEKLY